jgi:hypothetical protein
MLLNYNNINALIIRFLLSVTLSIGINKRIQHLLILKLYKFVNRVKKD